MAFEDTQYQSSLKYYEDLQKQFTTATNGIKLDIERWYSRIAKNNDISYAAAKKLLKANELDEFKWSVEEYIKRGEENGIDKRWMKELENASARHHISYLEAMKLQMQQHAEKLFVAYEGGVSKFLNKSYADNFYRTAYEIAKGTEVGTNLAALNSREIDLLMKSPWAQDGKNFSDRIWTNKEKLINNLHTELSQHIIRGSSPHIAIDNLAASMNVSKRQAGTLIMTESAAMASRATQECFKELDVEEYEVCETLDMITCTECQDMDGKRFMMPDFQVGMTAPPFHPRCRGTTVPYFDDEFTEGEERAARDEKGKIYYVSSNMPYPAWKNKYVTKETENQYKQILNITSQDGIKINNISEHLVDRAIERKVNAEDAKEALLNPLKIGKIKEKNGNRSKEYTGENARTIVNPDTGNIITVWKTSTRLREKLKGGKT